MDSTTQFIKMTDKALAFKAERDEALAILKRFVHFSKEMPQDLSTCLNMGYKIATDAEALLKRIAQPSE